MSLALLSPTGAVTTHPSGIIVVRCADYVAAGATTVSDADSVSGTVVSEDQTVAVQTTFASQGTLYGGLADTISIPNADLGLDSGASNYRVFVAARVLGDVPSNAKGGTDWEKVSKFGASYGFAWGKNTGWQDGPFNVARSRFEEYLIYDCGQLFGFSFTSLKVRGWGITGGTIELRFDLIYLVPSILGPDFNDTLVNAGRFGAPLRFSSDGTLYFDYDDDASTWIGAHSVMSFGFPWMQDGANDVQEDNDEPTVVIEGFGDWTDEAAPRGHLAFIAGGSKPPAAETMIDEDFSGVPDSVGTVDPGQNWVSDGYYSAIGGNSIDNSYNDGVTIWRGWVFRSGLPTAYFGANESATTPLHFGETSLLFGFDDGSSSSDPRDYKEVLLGIKEAVVEGAFRFDTLQEAYGFVGFDTTSGDDFRVGGAIKLDSSGNVEVSVRIVDRTVDSEYVMDSASAVITGVATSDIVRVKAERRGVTWRAKAWLDGGSEPGWQVEAAEPIVARSSAFVRSYIPAPWDTGWAASVDNDAVIYDPRGFIGTTVAFYPVAVAAVGPGLAQMKIDLFQFIVSFDPGSGTPGDMDVEVRKYDGVTVLDSAVTIPYGSHRLVTGPVKNRRFNTDVDAYSIWAWKAAGEPPTMFASVGYIWELRDRTPVLTFRPQIIRRVIPA